MIKRLFSSLVLAEHNNKKLSQLVYSAVNAAEYFNNDITVLVAGNHCGSVAEEASKIKGVSKVILADDSELEHQLSDSVTNVLSFVLRENKFKRVLAASSNFSKDVIPRLGGVLDVQPITEISKIMNLDCFKRVAYAGNAIYTVSTLQDLRLLIIRATSFEKNPVKAESAPIVKIKVENAKSAMR